MDLSELHRVKQRFTFGAHKSLINLTLPDPSSLDSTPILVYLARTHVTLNETEAFPQIGGEDADADEKEKGIVRVLAGAAFGLENIGAGTSTQNLETYVSPYTVTVTVLYLSINRPDLARKEFDQAKRWSEDDLLLQVIESFISLVTGKDSYSDCNSFYTEQLGSTSLSSAYLLTLHGVSA
ncbi:uncharacterized protein LAESUDRAFT_736470 [Laetiporus sulphureus 93-53]|uniref:Uncharacterized protein n=1 Tax=Laetiporus sulphureus 93-53 TaxID=1314785 RepID=A0A165EJ41_9APHY|nr:uncharacterized protein LAESUDRAFT_736470 [Laetiporus sulphureus 93-53]KZT07157.1 hypothetical protein LAESUDRAFT_736470 [Laetiporus sulphureus 93-53]